jgi:hypothetical protein
MTATGIISIAAAQYLTKKLLEHRLSKDLKDYDASISEKLAHHKASLDQLVNAAKAESEARLKKELDDYLEKGRFRGTTGQKQRSVCMLLWVRFDFSFSWPPPNWRIVLSASDRTRTPTTCRSKVILAAALYIDC